MARKPTPGPMRRVTPRPLRRLSPAPVRRRDVRYMVALPVLLVLPHRRIQAEAVDVAHGGMFVLTPEQLITGPAAEDALVVGRLIRVEMALPTLTNIFCASAKLVHRRPALARDERRGAGVQFYGLGRENQARWDAFIEYVRMQYPGSEERSATLATAEPVDASYLRTSAQVGTLRVEVRHVRDLLTMLRRDLKSQRIFLTSRAKAFIGDELAINVVHPLTEDVFELRGQVRRIVDDGGLRGLELDLLACDAARCERFEEFIYDAMAPMFDDELIEPESD